MLNKFQTLLESSEVQHYTERQRKKIGVVISDEYFSQIIIPAVQMGAAAHINNRVNAVKKKFGLLQKSKALMTVGALFDRHFRKQTRLGPTKTEVMEKVLRSLALQEPINLVGLMFTRKNICSLKRGDGDESESDFAETLSLMQLNSFASLIHAFHPYGATFTILSEGKRFVKAFDLCEPAVFSYQEKLHKTITRLNLQHLKLIDYEDFLNTKYTKTQQLRRRQKHEQSRKEYMSTIAPLLNLSDMSTTLERTIAADPIKDLRNPRNSFVPLWDSIKNSLPYPELVRLSAKKNIELDQMYRIVFKNLLKVNSDLEIEKVRQSIIVKSWLAAIEHSAQIVGDAKAGVNVAALISSHAFRTTINPKQGEFLGILTARETTNRVQPWHGMAFVEMDRQKRLVGTILTKLEIESKGGLPVYLDTKDARPIFYAASDVITEFQAKKTITFNMSTRDIKKF